MRNFVLTALLAGILILPSTLGQVFASPPEIPTAHPPLHIRPLATTSPTGYAPNQILNAYGFSQLSCYGTNTCGSGKTIAIVDAYDDPNAAGDLATFTTQFGLPACTVASHCFTKVFASGVRPSANQGWALEESLDVQWAHAIAPAAKIMLVEAQNNQISSLISAVDVAISRGANVVSMSWGASEFSGETSYDTHFNKTKVVFVASSGDSGTIEWPAASQLVTSVGGTSLPLDSSGNRIGPETAWSCPTGSSSCTGGGVSTFVSEPQYQTSYNIISTGGKRGNPDVSYDADPNTGVSVYDSAGYGGQKGWFVVGGTSAGSPQWAALVAIVEAKNSAVVPNNAALYKAASTTTIDPKTNQPEYVVNYQDITSGNNISYGATTGYDMVTGLGSPHANALIPYLTGQPT